MMLMQFDYLKTPLGGIIAVAAMVDDVASLVILAVLEELQDTTGTSSSVDWACILGLGFDFDCLVHRFVCGRAQPSVSRIEVSPRRKIYLLF